MTSTQARTASLRPREDPDIPARLAVSADTLHGTHLPTEQFSVWMKEREAAHAFEVVPIPFDQLNGWSFHPQTGNLGHVSGKFFTVEGLRVRQPKQVWHQPIINQAEVGILGILVKEFDGVLHFLMQAKMEPGNPNLLQLSPTVQATRSNYMRVHQGSSVRYLEYFAGAERGRVVADVLQSEHGAWFYRKRNRNMVVEVTGDVPLHDDFCWLTLGQINELMARDNVVNMDARTVLACLPQVPSSSSKDGFRSALALSRDQDAGALHTTAEVLSWFSWQRSETELDIQRIALYDLPGWYRTDTEIAREDGRFFKVVAADVRADSREVKGWSQPLFQPHGLGIAAFVAREYCGVLHLLVHARVEGGFADAVELGPTVQCVPWNYRSSDSPPFLDQVLAAGSSRIRYEAIHSEEGGRFLEAESRYLIVEADHTVPDDPPDGYAWVTVGQLADLLRHGQYVNVQARTLIACLNSLR
ncbi:NDP-hexose 2,3-dehydratase family protein [Lentzea flava]|uniref:NDP-hexose 2,3-dehydratase n=1 Tax=Lentzea flava TaxID=103732 RepID=A0ABQ2V7A0_9PSEU|nr:NDP-hexose 2,3-dehydratase family protein [Lentzea flava]MCP2203890.1 oxidase EvaA [Lentzea flava]GGU72538.1 NDP-hexose 2,3-dehydratase [Lentzea flava]